MADERARAVEAVVMVAERPVPARQLAQLLDLSVADVEALCSELALSYEAEDRGFQLQRIAGGYRYASHPDQAPYVEQFILDGQTTRLSAAALETLAIVAYKQPLSRAQISAIRGVDADGVIRTLLARGLVEEVGRDAGPGQAVLYGTTDLLLERLGLFSLDELPPLGEFVPESEIVEALERGLTAEPTGDGPEGAATGPDAEEAAAGEVTEDG